MEKLLAAEAMRVRCLADPWNVRGHDQAAAVELLWSCNIAGLLTPWHDRFTLSEQCGVVLMSGAEDGRLLGMLAASRRQTVREDFLLLEAAYVSPEAAGRNLLQRMVAAVVLNAARLDRMPVAVAACTRNAACARNLRALGGRLGGVPVFPQAEEAPVDLAIAGLAQRIARAMRPGFRYAAGTGEFPAGGEIARAIGEHALTVLALHGPGEAQVVAEARRILTRRPSRAAVRQEFLPWTAGDAMVAARPPVGEKVR